MTNQDYKNAALAALKGKWAPAVLASVVMILMMGPYMGVNLYPTLASMSPEAMMGPLFLGITGGSFLYLLLVYMPLEFGYTNACRTLLVSGDDRLTGNMFKIGFSHWLRFVWGYILLEIKVMLWMFVFIIPGFIKAFAYALTPFLLVDCPELSALQCIKLSNQMMKGHKFDLFYLYLSFIGWGLLCILTLGIGFLWLMPYMQTATAAFYQDVKEQYRAQLETAAPAETPAETPAE